MRGRQPFEDVPEDRRRNMRAIRGKDTTPELAVRRLAHGMGYRFRLHRADLPGRPDMVFPGRACVVEVRGCFWHQHGCANSATPKTRSDWWTAKLAANVARDRRNLSALRRLGWRVLVVWECQVARPGLAGRLRRFLGPPGPR